MENHLLGISELSNASLIPTDTVTCVPFRNVPKLPSDKSKFSNVLMHFTNQPLSKMVPRYLLKIRCKHVQLIPVCIRYYPFGPVMESLGKPCFLYSVNELPFCYHFLGANNYFVKPYNGLSFFGLNFLPLILYFISVYHSCY